MRSFQELTRRFGRGTRGSVSILFGVSMMVLMMIVALAVDSARFYNLEDKLQQSLDAAALAGAKLLEDESVPDSKIESVAKKFYRSSIEQAGVPWSNVKSIKVKINRNTDTVETSATVATPSIFAALTNRPSNVKIAGSSNVVYDMKKIEFAMVLDVTGSMGQNGKLSDLKHASEDVIDQLFSNANSEKAIRIALAPYSASVNAGSLASSASQNASLDSCVIERNNGAAGNDTGPYGGNKLPSVTTLPYGYYLCPTATVVPLLGKSQADTLKDTIRDYSAAGGTAGHIGTAWGWYLLSPDWAGVMPSDSKPEPYSDKKVKKAMLIMTDGEFNLSYKSGPNTDPATMIDESYQIFQTLCANAKAKEIQIYTVGFGLTDPRAIQELETCASDPQSFFNAQNGNALKDAFKEIGERLNNLRVAG
jgi:Flp pilus assembly protein TadG